MCSCKSMMSAPAAGFETVPPSFRRRQAGPVQSELTEQTRASIDDWLSSLAARNRQYLFPSRVGERPHLSTRHYARIVHAWVASAGLGQRRLRHSLDAADESSPDLQEDGESASGSPAAWTRKARKHAISASRSMTRSAFPSKSSCELKWRMSLPCEKRGCDPPGAMGFRARTIGRYHRRNACSPSGP